MSGTVVDLFTIQIVRADDAVIARPLFLTDPMEEMEENLTDLLPAGYRARIRRWDHASEDDRDDTWTDTTERELPRRRERR